jgi:hypothetical protein
VEASRVFVTVLPFVFVVVDLDHLDMDLTPSDLYYFS